MRESHRPHVPGAFGPPAAAPAFTLALAICLAAWPGRAAGGALPESPPSPPSPAAAPAPPAAADARAPAPPAPNAEMKAAPSPAEAERPWAKGVAPDAQRAALELFREGNSLLKESVFAGAAAKYREALRHWDHPAIHYNLVLALLNMDQPLEVRSHLVSALRWGPEPLDKDKFEQAKAYKVLVEKQLARVEIRCSEPGAQVVMDGRALFVAPGRFEDYVRPGPHTIVATKRGYLTNQLSKSLPAGETVTVDLKLFKTADLTRYRRKWAVGIPWAVLAAGAAVGLAGGGMHFGASKSFERFDKTVHDRGGSAPDAELDSLKTRGQALQGVAIGCYAAGGAAIVAGAVLVYVNRLQPFQDAGPLDPAEKDKARPRKTDPGDKGARPSIAVAPMLGQATGVAAVVRF